MTNPVMAREAFKRKCHFGRMPICLFLMAERMFWRNDLLFVSVDMLNIGFLNNFFQQLSSPSQAHAYG